MATIRGRVVSLLMQNTAVLGSQLMRFASGQLMVSQPGIDPAVLVAQPRVHLYPARVMPLPGVCEARSSSQDRARKQDRDNCRCYFHALHDQSPPRCLTMAMMALETWTP